MQVQSIHLKKKVFQELQAYFRPTPQPLKCTCIQGRQSIVEASKAFNDQIHSLHAIKVTKNSAFQYQKKKTQHKNINPQLKGKPSFFISPRSLSSRHPMHQDYSMVNQELQITSFEYDSLNFLCLHHLSSCILSPETKRKKRKTYSHQRINLQPIPLDFPKLFELRNLHRRNTQNQIHHEFLHASTCKNMHATCKPIQVYATHMQERASHKPTHARKKSQKKDLVPN